MSGAGWTGSDGVRWPSTTRKRTRTLTSLLAGFSERDVDELGDVYTDDADWVNAFGSVKHGRREIIAYLRGLFADANFNACTLKALRQSSIRVLTNEVVIVSTHLLIEGHKLLDGGVIDERDNHSLHVLQRQSDGTWPRRLGNVHGRQSRPVIRRSLITQLRSRK